MRRYLVLFVLLSFLTGCATQPKASLPSTRSSLEDEHRCEPPQNLSRVIPQDLPPDGTNPLDEPPALPGFSPHARKIARIIGIEGLLARLVALEEDRARGADRHVAILEVRQRISDRLLLVMLDIASASAEVNCKKERTDQLGDQLEEERIKRIEQLTIFAILGGALVGILSGGLSLAGEETAAAAGAITGGVLETVFGGAALLYDPR